MIPNRVYVSESDLAWMMKSTPRGEFPDPAKGFGVWMVYVPDAMSESFPTPSGGVGQLTHPS